TRYLVGAHPDVRHRIGVALNGDSHLVDVQSTYIRTPHLLDMMQGPACAIDCINPRCCGLMFANDATSRATRLLNIGLDFCCERSVAVEAGGAIAASWDRTPRVTDVGGVEVVR